MEKTITAPKSDSLAVMIIGRTATGKTALAFALNDFLRERGVEVEIKDPDLGPACGRTTEFNDRVMNVLPGRINILIETVQVNTRKR